MPRLLFIDNIRSTVIILVISMHAADTYSPLGNWYFVDRRPLSTPALLAFAAWQMYLQSFFMGLLFFAAGVFVPGSLDRKGTSRFVRERAFRLGLPVLFYMFVLGPVTEYFCAHSWTSTEPTSFANEWLKHIRSGEFLQENGPLWFCLALLIFSSAYALVRTNAPEHRQHSAAPRSRQLILFALVMAAFTFAVRLVLLAGGSFLNMHLGDFPQYILLFAAGILTARLQWLRNLDARLAGHWALAVLPAGFACWLLLLFRGGALTGHTGAYAGGWHWQSAAFDLWEAFTCVALCFGLLVLFRERCNSQGRFARFLSANAFAVYVFHPPILILLARALLPLSWHPLLLFLALTCLASIASFALSALLFRRIPLLRAIL